jgi:branched-chain amino acid transport system substrate-binding protein
MKRRTVSIFAPLLVLLLLLVACGAEEEPAAEPADDEPDTEEPADDEPEPADEPEDAEEPADEPSGDPIRIGATLGLTGAFAGPSEEYRVLYEAAVEELNEQGGLLGREVELVLYDDESTQDTAQGLYQRLINEDQVDLLLAPYTTFIGGAVVPVVRGSGLLMMNAGFTGWELARQYDKLFMLWPMQEPTWTQGFFGMLEELAEDQRPERAAVFTAQNPFTIMVRDGYEGELGVENFAADLGIDIVVEEEYPADATDVSGLIQRAQDADADLLMVLGLPNDSALFARTVAEVGYEPDIYCTCGSSVTTMPLWQDVGEAGNHVITPVPAWSSDPFPEIDTVIQIFEDAGFAEMPAYGPVAYAAIQVLAEAVEATESLDGDTLAQYIYDNEFETATGTLNFDEHGVPEFGGGVVQYVDDHNEMVWPEDRKTADPIVPRP